MPHAAAKMKPLAVGRARVERADGRREVRYSHDRVPWYRVRRRLKLRRHLAFMRAEDKAEGWA